MRGSYLFDNESERKRLLSRLDNGGWTAELSGPGGSGKSTLLWTLAGIARERGMRIVTWRCSDEVARLPARWRSSLPDVDVVFVDGAERCRSKEIQQLRNHCTRHGIGLIVTSHEPLGIGLQYPVCVTAVRFRNIVMRLDAELQDSFSEASAAILLTRHCGNARLALFELYDRYEDEKAGHQRSR